MNFDSHGYESGCHWVVKDKVRIFSIILYDKGHNGEVRKFFPGDILRDQFFSEMHWCLTGGFIKRAPREIDDEWDA